MHIPDGFLDLKTSAATAVLATGALALALRGTRQTLPPRRVPLLGLAAAFVFAGQMVNFPVAGGTSGHLVGAVLATVLLGPGGAVVALSAVLVIQCFVFADGGVLALGANVWNMAVVGAVLGDGIYRAARRVLGGRTLGGTVAAAAFAAWCATVLAAVACAAELTASGTAPWRVVFPAMAGVHMFIGVGEAVITALVVLALGRARPELLGLGATGNGGEEEIYVPGYRRLLAYGLGASLALAVLLSPLASKLPDGLNHVAKTHGFGEFARRTLATPFGNYTVPGIGSAAVATSLAGLVGTLLAFGLALAVSRVLAAGRGVNAADAAREATGRSSP